MTCRFHAGVILIALLAAFARAEPSAKIGVDANYALDMAAKAKSWKSADKVVDPFQALAAGAGRFRIRLWVGDDGVNRLRYATETARRAQAAGMKSMVVLFLSEDWADFVKQPAPAAWANLPPGEKLAAIEAYAEKVARHFAAEKIDVDTFEIGNEIDFGLCGVFEEAWPNRVSLDYMRAKIWPDMVPIIKAAQAGVLKASPDAKFVLHLAQWNKPDYCLAFFKFMTEAGVKLDYLGLSYFPSSATDVGERSLAFMQTQVNRLAAELKRPVMVCESGYPCEPKFGGQFADWNKPADGYPLSPDGQAKWVADFTAWAKSDPNISVAFYWSPEWHGGGLWDAFAFYDANGNARPALAAFTGTAPATQPATTQAVVLRPTTRPAVVDGLHVYFGNLHAHTANSDGTGTPDEAFAFARDVAKLDFLALTEHNHLLGGAKAKPDQRAALYQGPGPNALLPAAEKNDRPGAFVALYGQEFSSMSKGNHVNVFDVPAVIDVPNGKFDGLLDWMTTHKDSTGQTAVVQFNHPGLTFPPNVISKNEYGRDDFGSDAEWIKRMGEVSSLIELLNGEPDGKANFGRSPQIMESDYRLFLREGFKLAPTGNQDNHRKMWGTSTDTRTGVISAELTKPSLLTALRQRHAYASEDKNLVVVITVNGKLCGDVLNATGPLDVAVHLSDPDDRSAKYTIEAVRGSIAGPAAEVVATATLDANLPANEYRAFDGLSLTAADQFLYFRITQVSPQGTDRAWTAPVWAK